MRSANSSPQTNPHICSASLGYSSPTCHHLAPSCCHLPAATGGRIVASPPSPPTPPPVVPRLPPRAGKAPCCSYHPLLSLATSTCPIAHGWSSMPLGPHTESADGDLLLLVDVDRCPCLGVPARNRFRSLFGVALSEWATPYPVLLRVSSQAASSASRIQYLISDIDFLPLSSISEFFSLLSAPS